METEEAFKASGMAQDTLASKSRAADVPSGGHYMAAQRAGSAK